MTGPAVQQERARTVDGTSIDPDADSLDALRDHALRRLKRLRGLERSIVDQLRIVQDQINRERMVLMLNGVDPDVEQKTAKDAPPAKPQLVLPGEGSGTSS